MTTSTQPTAGSFAQKARLNGEFVLAATPELSGRHDRGMRGLIALQPVGMTTDSGPTLILETGPTPGAVIKWLVHLPSGRK